MCSVCEPASQQSASQRASQRAFGTALLAAVAAASVPASDSGDSLPFIESHTATPKHTHNGRDMST